MNAYGTIGQNILIIDKYFKIYFKKALAQYGINTAEGFALLMLFERKCETQDQIVENLHYDKGAMARTMKSLEEKGLVTREANKLDSRSYVFHTTKQAMDLKPHLIEILSDWGNLLFSGVDNLEKLNESIILMAKNASDGERK